MEPLIIFRLRGTQAEMGAQHGALLAARGGWEKVFHYYPSMPLNMLISAGRRGAGGRRERLARRLGEPAVERALMRLERNRPRPYLERSRALVEALDLGPSHARYLLVMDLFQNLVGLACRLGLAPVARRVASVCPPACSTLMAWGARTEDGRLLHARNFDFPGTGLWEKTPSLVLCTPDEGLRYAFATTRGGDVPATAFNEAGLTLTAHTRFHRDVSFRGLPITDLCHEIIRRASTLDEAIAVARELPSASTWGLCVSSAAEGRAAVLELTGAGLEVFEAPASQEFLASTNRYHHAGFRVDEVVPSAAWANNCDGRLASLLRHGRAAQGWGVQRFMQALGDHTDPDTGAARSAGGILAQPLSVQSVVADLSRGVLHLSTGAVPSGRGPYQEVTLDFDGPVESWEAQGPRSARQPVGDEIDPAWEHYAAACRLEQRAARPEAIEAALREAAALRPSDPDYRFLLGMFAARRGALGEAWGHLEQGLRGERSPFPRGQLLLWGARVAAARGDGERATALRRELLNLAHPLLADHHAAASRELRGARAPALRGVAVNVQLVDAG